MNANDKAGVIRERLTNFRVADLCLSGCFSKPQ